MKSLFNLPAKLSLKRLQKKSSRSSFAELRAVDNFYQTSLFFPMPTVLISTLTEDGKTTVGPYSLVQPYYVAGKDYYAMLLNAHKNRPDQHDSGQCQHNDRSSGNLPFRFLHGFLPPF